MSLDNTPDNNLAACLHMLLVLGVMLIGFVVMLGGVPAIGWLISAIGRLLAPLGATILRGLVILAILGVIFVLVSQKLAGTQKGYSVNPISVEPQQVGSSHGPKH